MSEQDRAGRRAVGESFGRAARSYDAHATLQLAAARTLLGMLPEMAPALALDIGVGTGPVTRALCERLPGTCWLALDIAEPMLREGVTRGRFVGQCQPVCADALQLPLAAARADLIWSSFALQWCDDLPALTAEIARVLAPGGTFAVCLPVAGTLDELRASWAEVDDAPHVNHFYRADDWRAALGDAGLYADIAHTQQIREHYPDVRAIGTRLRATGAHHVQRSVSPGLTSRRRYAALQAAYERRRTDAGLPLTWQVHYAIFRQPPTE